MKANSIIYLITGALVSIGSLNAESTSPSLQGSPIPVTVGNFIRAETDTTFAGVARQGGFGKIYNYRQLAPIESHIVQRANRDTLYSTGFFDLNAGPVTITLPDSGKRFMTMMVIDEDHNVVNVFYGAGSHTLTKEKIGTRYALVAVRILVDPNDSKDVEQVHALQDAIKVSQPGGPGKFEPPNWDTVSHEKLRNALVVLGATLPDYRHAAGHKGEYDPIKHLIATATAWGLNPDKDAIYLNITPAMNDGVTPYSLTVKDVPVDGFWSISVYSAEGYFIPNDEKAYSLNSITAKRDPNGSVTAHFGGPDTKVANNLPIVKGWNYMVRLYRPRKEILNDTWTFPVAQPLSQAGASYKKG